MQDLIKTSFETYLLVTIFLLVWFFWVGVSVVGKTKKIRNAKKKIGLRIGVLSVFVVLWGWFACAELYPISLAYYEYSNDIVKEKIGSVESVDQEIKDRMDIKVDGTVYTMVYSSQKPYKNVSTRTFGRGDRIYLKVGQRSNYIFDIRKVKEEYDISADEKSYPSDG